MCGARNCGLRARPSGSFRPGPSAYQLSGGLSPGPPGQRSRLPHSLTITIVGDFSAECLAFGGANRVTADEQCNTKPGEKVNR